LGRSWTRQSTVFVREALNRLEDLLGLLEAVLTLTDLYGLDSEAATASIVHTAGLITEATLSRAQ
jgi:hypothetical protein